MTDLSVCPEDAEKLHRFFEDRISVLLAKDPSPSPLDVFYCDEIFDFLWEEDISFYGHFDWKDESTGFDAYVRKALLRNFGYTIPDIPDPQTGIHEVYKSYGKLLEPLGITLNNIDIDGDCYLVALVRTEHYESWAALIREVRCKPEHFLEEW